MYENTYNDEGTGQPWRRLEEKERNPVCNLDPRLIPRRMQRVIYVTVGRYGGMGYAWNLKAYLTLPTC